MKKHIFTIIIASLVLTGCSLTSEKIEEEQKQEKINQTELKLLPVSEEEIELDQMYVKAGDEYYKTMTDYDYYFNNNEKPSNDRHIFLKDNDVLVPTLFKDDILIYNTTSLIPERFELERFEDVGYSFGMFGLDMTYLGKIQLRYDDDHIVYGTSFSNLFEGYEDGTVFLLDKLDGKKLDNSFITRSGTIKDLTYGKEYELEYYLGSNYIKQKAISDVHVFTSFEVYDTSDFKFNTDSKLKINMPKGLPSGYYLINGQYFIRYCNRLRKEGIKNVNFNEKTNNQDKIDINEEEYEEEKTYMEELEQKEINQEEIDEKENYSNEDINITNEEDTDEEDIYDKDTYEDDIIEEMDTENALKLTMLMVMLGVGLNDNPSITEEMKKSENEILLDKIKEPNIYLKDISEKDVKKFVKDNYNVKSKQ